MWRGSVVAKFYYRGKHKRSTVITIWYATLKKVKVALNTYKYMNMNRVA